MRLPLLGESNIHCQCRRMTSGKNKCNFASERLSGGCQHYGTRQTQQKAHPSTRIANEKTTQKHRRDIDSTIRSRHGAAFMPSSSASSWPASASSGPSHPQRRQKCQSRSVWRKQTDPRGNFKMSKGRSTMDREESKVKQMLEQPIQRAVGANIPPRRRAWQTSSTIRRARRAGSRRGRQTRAAG